MSATEVSEPTSRRRHLVTAWITAVLVTIVVLTSPKAVIAQSSPSITPASTIRLVDQTSWVTGGSPFSLVVRPSIPTTVDPGQLEISVTVYAAVANRSQFQNSLQNRLGSSSVIVDKHPLSDLLRPDGTASVTLPVQDPNQKRFYLRSAGVYPVKVELSSTDSDEPIDSFVTHIINEPQQASVKLGVSLILPVQSPQSFDPKQPFHIDDRGNSVTTTSQALASHPNLPLTLLPEPETVDRLQRPENDPTRQVLSSLIAATGQRPVLGSTWVPLPASAFEKTNNDEFDRQLQAGNATVRSRFTTVDSKTWAATEPIDSTALPTLESKGFSQLIVRENDLSSVQRSTTLTRPFLLSAGKNKPGFKTLQADSALADHVADPQGPALGAHRLLADLAVLWSDFPGNERVAVVMPPRNWLPDGTFLNTVFDGLNNSPVLSPVTLDQAFATPLEGGSRSPLTLKLDTVKKEESSTLPTGEIADQRTRLAALGSMVATDNTTLADLRQLVFLSERADLDDNGHRQWINIARDKISEQLNGIHLPKERSISLTSRQGEIPVTVQNDNGYAVQVRVRLTAAKLEFPDGDIRTINAARQYSTERFTVNTRTSGAFAVRVQLESPDGGLVLQKSEITVRSTATSIAGIVLSVGALAFLVVWWIRSTVKARRKSATT